MNSLVTNTAFGGVLLTIAAYMLGLWLKRRLRVAICNPILVAVLVIIIFLLVGKVDYNDYAARCSIMDALVTPATVCFAIPLYKQIHLLRRNWPAIVGGITAGVVASVASVFAVAKLCTLNYEQYVTLLPKSLTAAIGVGVAQELGGLATITVVAIMITGLTGNVVAEPVLRLCKITEPVAMGVAIGTSSHILGTTKAVELGEVQGAMSSLSIVVAGLLTVLVSPFFALLIK